MLRGAGLQACFSLCGACVGVDGRVLGTNLLPFLASVKYGWSGEVCYHKLSNHFRHWINMDGVEKACWAQTLHPFPVSVKSDGMTDMKCLMSSIYRKK